MHNKGVNEMDWQNERVADEDEYFIVEEVETKPKKRLPNPITTPKRGPLLLSTRTTEQPARKTTVHAQHHNTPRYFHRQRYLNRFPIPDVQRPIEIIERNLGGVSVAELKHQAFADWSHWSRPHRGHPVLPTLNPLMKYSPIGTHHHGGNTNITTSQTHQASGPMDILITYSRHATPVASTFPRSQQWTYPNPKLSHGVTMPTLKETRAHSYNIKQTVTPPTEHVQLEDNYLQIESDNSVSGKPLSPRPARSSCEWVCSSNHCPT